MLLSNINKHMGAEKKMEKLQNEIKKVLEQAGREHCGFPEVNWFLQTMEDAFSAETLMNEKPSLIVLGEDIPRELALALSDYPRFILGGSLETTHWSDALLPRDADPVSRSACGWLLNDEFNLAENAIVVMALSSDNRRKLASLLRGNGIKVATADMPPRYDTAEAQEAWVMEMLRLADAVSSHTHIRLSSRRLKIAIREREHVREAAIDFENIAWQATDSMSPALRDIIMESAWYASDRKEWVYHLRNLTAQMTTWIKQYYHQPDVRPWVLLAGSPIVFPNEKLPSLLEASGLYLADRADPIALQTDIPCADTGRSVQKMLRRTTDLRMRMETSGSWISNDGLLSAVQNRLEHLPVSGIIWHVLKGQIEYDFELPKVEALAAEYGVPVIRLETDYQQQDVEQLRIRLEAFAEMLRVRNQERIRIAQ